MSRKIILVLIIGILVIGGGVAAYSLTRNNQSTTNNTQQPAETQQQTNEQSSDTNGNIFSLVDSGKAQKCTFSYSGGNGTGEGTMYSDGTGRGAMMMNIKTDQGSLGDSNLLVVNDKVYGWTVSNGKSVGFVFDKAKLTSGSDTAQTSSSVDPNQTFNLNCESWVVDETILTVPTDINFMSLPG